MPREITEILSVLDRTCELRTPEEIDGFLGAVEELRQIYDPSALRQMLRCFRDVDAGEVQYELVDAVEQYPAEDYVPAFVEEGERLYSSAPNWFRLLFQSILNTPLHRSLLVNLTGSLSPKTREFLAQRLESLVGDNPNYAAILTSLRERWKPGK